MIDRIHRILSRTVDTLKYQIEKGKFNPAFLEMDFRDVFGYMSQSKMEEDMKQRMGLFYTYYEQLQAILSRERVLCLMEPVEIDF